MSESYIPESEITDDDRLWAMLAYLLSPIVPIIILLMDDRKDRGFIKAHNIQALVWGVIGYAVSSLLAPVFFIGCVVWVAYAIITIIWALKANKGELVEIPVITNFVKKQGWA